VRITPEQFQTIYSVFIGIILLFFVFVGIQILTIRHRQNSPPPRRAPRPAGPPGGGRRTGDSSGATHATFGTSGIGAGDVAPAGGFASTSSDLSSSGDIASGSWDSSDTGGGDYGGGDFSGGGGDSGGGGSSGSWS
jgi:hypothetical protein